MESFQYCPLDPDRNEIRLLYPIVTAKPCILSEDVLLEKDETVVEPDLCLDFELRTVSLHDKPSYTALSYVWGKEKEWIKSIRVNGVRFLVGSNLECALRHLQYADIAPAIWIDSVCINQKDNHEKSYQVPRMRLIYSGATQIVVWLSPATEHSDQIADFLFQFCKAVHQRFNVPPRPKYPLIDYIDFATESDAVKFIDTIIGLTPSVRSGFSSMVHFLDAFASFITSRPWWFRVWIVQEFVTAPEYFFQVGSRKFGTEELGTFMAILIVLLGSSILSSMKPFLGSSNLTAGIVSFQWILELHSFREIYHKKSKRQNTLYELLCRTYCRQPTATMKELDAGDDRDRVYALFGLVELNETDANNQIVEPLRLTDFPTNERKRLVPEVDYNRPCHQVFVDVAQHVLKGGDFDILAFCQPWNQKSFSGPISAESRDKLDPSKLPSWAPNWTQLIQSPNSWWKVGQGGRRVLGNDLFSASSSSIAKLSFTTNNNIRDIYHSYSMTVRGVLVDHVLEVKPPYLRSSAVQYSDVYSIIRTLFKDIRSLCEASRQLGHDIYNSGQLREAMWRMPIWDHEVNSDDDTVQRATVLSKDRYSKLIGSLNVLDDLLLRGEQNDPDTWILSSENTSADVNIYIGYIFAGSPMRPFITRRGYIGLGPATMQPEDTICIFLGARVPHVLRRVVGGCSGYKLVGQAYIHGIMDGELMSDSKMHEDFKIF